MSRGVITYSSQTGNTKKLAEVLFEELRSEFVVELKSVDDTVDPRGLDWILHGIWVDRSKPDKKSRKFLADLPQGMPVGIFGTSGGEHAKEFSQNLDREIQKATENFDRIGVCLIGGSVDPKLMEKMDSFIGNFIPKKIKEMAKNAKEATDEERLEVAEYFKEKLREREE